MADVLKLKKGLLKNLGNADYDPGSLYITTDEVGLYIDLQREKSDGTTEVVRSRIGDLVVFNNLEEWEGLPEKSYSESALYYITEGNMLLKYTKTGIQVTETKVNSNGTTEEISKTKHWIQINSSSDEIQELKNTVSNNEIKIQVNADEIDRVKQSAAKDASDAAKDASEAANKASEAANKASEAANTASNAQAAAKNASDAADAAQTSADAAQTSADAAQTSARNAQTSATAAQESAAAAAASAEEAVNTANNADIKANANSQAIADLQQKDIDIEKLITNVNSMTFKGTVEANTEDHHFLNLPTNDNLTVKAGDTYVVSGTMGYFYPGGHVVNENVVNSAIPEEATQDAYAGDLIIATSTWEGNNPDTENLNNDIRWYRIQSGFSTNSLPTLSTSNNQIRLNQPYDSINNGKQGVLTFVDPKENEFGIKMSSDSRNNITLSLVWGEF